VVASGATGGARAFVTRVGDAVQGELDHVVALGSWRPGSSGPSSSLEGNETTMRLGGAIGERGAMHARTHNRRSFNLMEGDS
jgi:outer membrane receptor protein involved in Fe transport